MKILVVDDEVGVTTALQRGLIAEGFEVEIANDGEEGLWLAQTGRCQAIVLDIMLSKKSGFRVCAELRGCLSPVHRRRRVVR